MTVDEAAKRELTLYAENESSIYGQKESIIKNLKLKIARGVYDHAKAARLWQYWVDNAARKYVTEFGGHGDVRLVFPKETREAAAKEVADVYRDEIKRGEWGPLPTISKRSKFHGTKFKGVQ